jgi:hypothetical protein
METKNIIPVESILERDVDLIILEELSTDDSFCQWFVNELNFPNFTKSIGAWRSVTSFGLGETDILFAYFSEEKRVVILIENKLDSDFQELQHIRYQKRANQYIENNDYDESYCVLIAPTLYCEYQNHFESFISYENISARLVLTGTRRNLFKSELLKIAIEKLRRGYQPINSELVQRFWLSYWKYKEEAFPTFVMKKPEIVPHNSDWPMLYDENLKGIVFYHKLGQGNSDVTFNNSNKEIEVKLNKIVPEFAKLIYHKKSFSIRVFSGKVDRTKDFETQIENINSGLSNLHFIRNLLIENKSYLFDK